MRSSFSTEPVCLIKQFCCQKKKERKKKKEKKNLICDSTLACSRPSALVLTRHDECYMWRGISTGTLPISSLARIEKSKGRRNLIIKEKLEHERQKKINRPCHLNMSNFGSI